MVDSRLARMIDRHVQGLDDPNAPFNQVTDPLWMCTECTWFGEDPIEKEFREISEAWGSKMVTASVEYHCPECGGDCTEYDGRYHDEGPEWCPEDDL